MNDKQARYFIVALAVAGFIYWSIKGNKAGSAVLIETPQTQGAAVPVDPITEFFANNPQAFTPQNLNTVNVTIANQGLNYLNDNYIPLFGFVGMAQGAVYQ